MRDRPRPCLYAGPARAEEATRLRTRAEILLDIQAFIEAHLGDPELDPDRIARASFISTRYLHKLFESEGTSVCRWIRETRLERCRRDLLDPALDDDTILDDRKPLGPAGAAALQPALPLRLRVLAERPPARAPQRRRY